MRFCRGIAVKELKRRGCVTQYEFKIKIIANEIFKMIIIKVNKVMIYGFYDYMSVIIL